MSSLYVCNRTAGKCCRLSIDGVNLSGTVSDFRRSVSKVIDLPSHEIELLYCGCSLQDDKTLESYGAKPGVTVHALRKHDTEMQQDVPEKMDSAVIQHVVTALQAALMNPAYRTTVERMLTDPETLENIIAATPGLDRDPVAISMLQDPELLAMLADPNNIEKVIDAHPALGQAAMMVAAAVNEEGSKESSHTSRSSRGTYSLDQMSDDEDMEGAGPRASLGVASMASITASQLAAAIAAAGGSGQQATPVAVPNSSSTSAQPSTSSSSSSSMITSDFFRHAIAAAAGSSDSSQASTGSTPNQDQPPHVLQTQVEQLRDMGITNEAVARSALQATDGNLEAAIELLFSDGGGF